MEWKDRPSDRPLERSGIDDGERNRYSREAGENSSLASRRPRRGEANSDDLVSSSGTQTSQMRRRRRISEMNYGKRPSSQVDRYDDRSSSRNFREDYPYERGQNQRNEQRNYYKEQYSQVREAKRQRISDRRDATDESTDTARNHSFGAPQRQRRNNNNNPQKRKMVAKKRQEKEPPQYDLDPIDINEEVRLNKFLSNAGVCSRREADELIKVGAVVVNGIPATELGTKISAQDRIEVNGREVKPERKVYILLNKPRNCVTTTDDPQERLTVTHLVRNACRERIYPVGRLDRNTTGVLLLTNDGDLAAQLVHPSFKKKKIYHVWLDKEVTIEDMQRLADGVELDDGEMHADAISYVTEDDHTQVGIEIHSGRNRIVRRLFEHLGYHVKKLDRVYFAGLTKKNLGRGKWRYLTQDEVNNLKRGAFE